MNTAGKSAFHPESSVYRYTILFLICMLTFGSYFSYDTPGASVSQLLDKSSEGNPHMTSLQYNLLYSLYAWPNVVIVFVGGYFVDWVGPRVSGTMLLALVTLGQTIMSLGAFMKSVMVIFAGRLIFASGAELLIVCQGAMIFKWFSGKELAVAFGFSLTFARLGTIACFAFLPNWAQTHGVGSAFGVGAALCLVSDVLFLFYIVLDKKADEVLSGEEEGSSQELNSEQPGTTGGPFSLSMSFWLCVGTLTSNYGSIMAFLAVAIDLLKKRFGISATTAGLQISFIYYISMILAPVIGSFLDKYGFRGVTTFVGAVFNAILFCGLSIVSADGTSTHAAGAASVVAILTGLSLGFLSSSVWPTIPIIVSPVQVGMAIGVAQALQNLGVGMCTMAVGHIYDRTGSYRFVMFFFAGVSICSVLFAAIWNAHDFIVKGKVNSVEEKEVDEEGVRYMGGSKVMVIEVAPMAVLVVRRKFYEDIGVGQVGMKRRDYYRSLGINDLDCVSPEQACNSPTGSYVPPLIRGSKSKSVEVPDECTQEVMSSSLPLQPKSPISGSAEMSSKYGSTKTADFNLREAVLSKQGGMQK
mmetsp:Transcript_864/g.2775  ORF Transcript_864/g.2775 Transcript_864/m.2775 type:complete len:583 (-) Transcript_864:1651-3399(-)